MKKIFSFSLVLLFAAAAMAQTETFDIATFIPPTGWQRIDSNGTVAFYNYRTNNGLTSFCQIFLYPSHPSMNSAAKNFQAEWANLIARPTGNGEKPKTETETTPDKWTVVTGRVNIAQNGVTYTCMLICASGFGKVMSMRVNVAGQDYMDDVNVFFQNLDLHAEAGPGVNWENNTPPQTVTGSMSDYVYEIPPGWNTSQRPDGIVLTSTNGEKCTLALLAPRPAGNNLTNDAVAIFSEVFRGFELKRGSTQPSMVKGVSPQGWEYYIVKNGISQPGNDYIIWGFVFVAKLGNQLVPIWGMSKDPLVSSCFGLIGNDVWPKFFYSLHFKNWQVSAEENAVTKEISGVWMAVTATAGDRFAFAPNGRFAGAAAAQRYYQTSSFEMMRVTDAYFGDGAYSINDNHIFFTHDNDKSNPETGFIRIEQESKDGGRTWAKKLYLLRKSVVDGSEYEVAYDRQ